ncbi:DNA repair protein Rad60 isoform X1 [Linepithema humile]|uniref:DNA repair protein Rad60 isoform X1 n=1 Tax=Linepithema humile TaxID=83485 RepID=UPI0006237B8F|nr:PREDICTED: uncharacterized protein CG4449 isoform X1 [Linepithema humile]XP_012218391.1 PREDICTED: uncharacterized protein CG4449 isoform X1 [Linepithema humile]XP_012218392.1 PREDICTED: uncharacterized protein CG4449 isoform X1 [Linepithema humile]
MDNLVLNSSSDEDDPYTNSVARLKALKRQRFEKEIFTNKKFPTKDKQEINENLNSIETNSPILLEINSNEKNDNELNDDGIQTRSKTVRRKKGGGITNYTTVRRKKKRFPYNDDLQCDVELISIEENFVSIPESCKKDIITLSDDDACEDDNYELHIKILWRSSRLDRLSIRKHDCFQKIFQHYADLEHVSIDEILIMNKDKIVKYSDTPALLKLSVIDILDGGIVNPGMKTLSEGSSDNENICSIKVQTANKKQSLIIILRRDQQFKALFANCAEQLGVKENSLKLYFDGEQISPTDTPDSLDLEGEACVDLHM